MDTRAFHSYPVRIWLIIRKYLTLPTPSQFISANDIAPFYVFYLLLRNYSAWLSFSLPGFFVFVRDRRVSNAVEPGCRSPPILSGFSPKLRKDDDYGL